MLQSSIGLSSAKAEHYALVRGACFALGVAIIPCRLEAQSEAEGACILERGTEFREETRVWTHATHHDTVLVDSRAGEIGPSLVWSA